MMPGCPFLPLAPSSSQLLDFWLYQLHQVKRKEERENWTKWKVGG